MAPGGAVVLIAPAPEKGRPGVIMHDPQPWPWSRPRGRPLLSLCQGTNKGHQRPWRVRAPLPPACSAPWLAVLPYRCICCPLLAMSSSARLPAADGGHFSLVLPLCWGDSSGFLPWGGLSHMPLQATESTVNSTRPFPRMMQRNANNALLFALGTKDHNPALRPRPCAVVL